MQSHSTVLGTKILRRKVINPNPHRAVGKEVTPMSAFAVCLKQAPCWSENHVSCLARTAGAPFGTGIPMWSYPCVWPRTHSTHNTDLATVLLTLPESKLAVGLWPEILLLTLRNTGQENHLKWSLRRIIYSDFHRAECRDSSAAKCLPRKCRVLRSIPGSKNKNPHTKNLYYCS